MPIIVIPCQNLNSKTIACNVRNVRVLSAETKPHATKDEKYFMKHELSSTKKAAGAITIRLSSIFLATNNLAYDDFF
jgi:hypothetical protein